jgi:hypothetical protein
MWNAIARLNPNVCLNPLHGFHRVPTLDEPPMYLGALHQAAMILADSFRMWGTAMGRPDVGSPASDAVRTALAPYLHAA